MNKFYYSLRTHYKQTTKVLQTSTNLYSSTRVWLRNPEFADGPPDPIITLRRVRNPSAPSSEEVWQSLRDYRAGIPERLARWKQAELASQETLAQVEQHEPSSRDRWPGLRRDVAEYVRRCGECQRHKVNNRPTKAPLQPIYPRDDATPFEVVALDFITKLPSSQGYDSILTITDQGCTKMAHFVPCNEAITAEETAQIFLEVIVRRYGLPNKTISDRDPRFTSKFISELCRTLGIQQNISSAYHPRTDGQSERNNQWVETYLRFYTNHQQTDWVTHLPLAKFAHNSWKNETTKSSPFFLL